ncbi:MAG: hypothetical protein Q4A06_03295 [Cardiobacteriaceae bacterium]|nr:hypothetical protein [Cardiobacteriaceae bacterium]
MLQCSGEKEDGRLLAGFGCSLCLNILAPKQAEQTQAGAELKANASKNVGVRAAHPPPESHENAVTFSWKSAGLRSLRLFTEDSAWIFRLNSHIKKYGKIAVFYHY